MGRLFCGIWPPKEGDAIFVHIGDAKLYRHVKGEAVAQVVISELGLPNGLTWNLKKKKFYYIDSLAYDVREYDYDEKTGNICKILLFFNYVR